MMQARLGNRRAFTEEHIMSTTKLRTLAAALLCGALTLGAGAAHADRDHWRHPGKGWKHHHHHYHPDTVIRERVIIRERPRYYERHYYPAPAYYPAPVYRRDPAVVIGVQIPPLVIPLR